MNYEFKNIALFLLIVIALTSCCKRFVPTTTTDVKDSVHERTVIQYHSDTIHLKGDTVTLTKQIPCPDVKIEEHRASGRAKLDVSLKNGLLKVDCHTDSLLHVIDSLETRITEKNRIRTETITIRQPMEVIKHRVPAWCWWLIAGVVAYISGKIFFKTHFLKI